MTCPCPKCGAAIAVPPDVPPSIDYPWNSRIVKCPHRCTASVWFKRNEEGDGWRINSWWPDRVGDDPPGRTRCAGPSSVTTTVSAPCFYAASRRKLT